MIRCPAVLLAVALFAGCSSLTPTHRATPPAAVATTQVSGPNAPVDMGRYQKPIRVACVGDSITYGYGLKNRAAESYPAQLQRMLGTDDWQVRNFGVNGATMLDDGNKPYRQQRAFREALAFNPEVVVIMLGTNDSKPVNWARRAGFEADAEQFVREFQALPAHPRVFICHPILVADDGKWGINEPVVREELPLIDAAAQKTGAGIIDMQPVLRGHEPLLRDHVHPDAEGARLMAEKVYAALTGRAAM